MRGFSINFQTTFPEATTGLLAGLLADDWGSFAPRPDGAGGLTYPTIAQLGTGNAPGVPFDPSTGFSTQIYGALFGMLYVPLSYDHTFLEMSRIWVEGGAEGVAIPAGERVELVDPFTSVRYYAASYPDARGREQGVGARMLLHAAALEAEGSYYELDQFMDVVNLMRTLSWEYGFGV